MVPNNGAGLQFCMEKICLIVKIAWKNRTRIPSATTGTTENMTVFLGYYFLWYHSDYNRSEGIGGREFFLAFMDIVPGYFYRKIEEKQKQKNSLAV